MASLLKIISREGDVFEVTADNLGNISHPKTVFSEDSPTSSNVLEKGVSWINTTHGILYYSEGSGVWSRVNEGAEKILRKSNVRARPNKLVPYDSVPARLFAADSNYAYGHNSNGYQFVRVDVKTRELVLGHSFGAAYDIQNVTIGWNSVFAIVKETATNLYSLYRSDDNGNTFTLVHEIGTKDGTHHPFIYILDKGMDRGYIKGKEALIFVTYNVNNVGSPGADTDTVYIASSIDDGVTWTIENRWNIGTRKIRHGHAVAYNPYNDTWVFCFGDTDSQACTVVWDGDASLSVGDILPTAWANVSGFNVGTGSQRWRAVDCMVTEDYLYTFSDTGTTIEGGIWRMDHDLSNHHRVDNKAAGKVVDGWASTIAPDGTLLWSDSPQDVSSSRFNTIYGSSNGDEWFEIGRIYTNSAGTALPQKGFFTSGDYVWIQSPYESGKTVQHTNLYTMGSTFIEERPDNLGPCYYVDFDNGNDSNDGYSRTSAWKTARNCMSSNKITYGARVMLLGESSTEDGVSQFEFFANANESEDTTARVQISGQGMDNTTITLSGSTEGWRDSTTSETWKVELEDLTITAADTSHSIIWTGSGYTTPPTWYLRNARIGTTGGTGKAVYMRDATAYLYRCEVNQGTVSSNHLLRAAGGGTIIAESCILVGGENTQDSDGQFQLRHCTLYNYIGTGVLLNTGSSVEPVIANCLFFGHSGSNSPIVDNSGGTLTLTASDVFGCWYIDPAGSGVPDPIVTVSDGPAINLTTFRPYEYSYILGVASPVGTVYFDYYGNPFRKNPAIGAVEALD